MSAEKCNKSEAYVTHCVIFFQWAMARQRQGRRSTTDIWMRTRRGTLSKRTTRSATVRNESRSEVVLSYCTCRDISANLYRYTERRTRSSTGRRWRRQTRTGTTSHRPSCSRVPSVSGSTGPDLKEYAARKGREWKGCDDWQPEH